MKHILTLSILGYFRALAKLQLLKNKPLVIGVTGSAGKSSELEVLAALLQDRARCKVGRKANSESGISLNILGLEAHSFSPLSWLLLILRAPLQLLSNWERYDYYLVEMGIDSPFPPKNMSYLLSIVQPKIGIITSVAPAHTEAFDPLISAPDPQERKVQLVEAIAREKGKLISTLPADGLGVIPADNPVVARGVSSAAKIVSFGTSAKATVQCVAVQYTATGTSFTFMHQKKEYRLVLPNYYLPGHFGSTIAAALCVADFLKIPLEQASKSIAKNLRLPPGRASVFSAINGAKILDSSYNASAQPMIDMLELLKHLPAARRLALLGDMRELGSLTKEEHTLVAKTAGKVLDEVVLVGPNMKEYALPIFEEKKITAHWFPSAVQAALYLRTNLRSDDLVLVKGSQNTLLLEIAIAELLADPRDEKKLARRGHYWDKVRKKITSPPSTV